MAGIRTPSVSDTKRAREEWMQEILNDIWNKSSSSGNTRLKTLQATAMAISVDNQRHYTLPPDFNEELRVSILDGDHTGTAQGGTINTVTLQSDEDISQADAEGRYILMTGGTSKGQYAQIISYNTTTKAAIVHKNWDTTKTPANGDTYSIIHKFYDVDEVGVDEMDELITPTNPGLPTRFMKFNDVFIFDVPFDKSTYGIQLRYYANIHNVDLAEGDGTLITKIYTNWQSVLKEGIQWKAEKSMHDDAYKSTKAEYEESLLSLILKELPYGGEFIGFTV